MERFVIRLTAFFFNGKIFYDFLREIFMKKFLVLVCVALISISAFSFETTELTASPGASVLTGGWADLANMAYMKADITLIDDATYPEAKKKREAFTRAISSSRPVFVVLSGDVDLSDGKISDTDHSYFDEFSSSGERKHGDTVYEVGSNTTLIGINNARVMFGGLHINGKKNIIIRNVTFYDAHGSTEKNTKKFKNSKASIDAINVEGGSSAIWIDHCSFTDGTCIDLQRNFNHDGQLDFKDGKNITVSYCEFTNHDKVMLIRPGDSLTNPKEALITLHHNYFHGAIQRMPRSRGCQLHIYNNFYDQIGIPENSGSSLGPGVGSMYVVENNCFGRHQETIIKYYDSSASAKAKTFSKIYQSGNIPELKSATFDKVDKTKNFKAHLVTEKPFEIPYEYTLEDAASIKASLPAAAGANKKMTVEGLN